ncbi:MAG TPA: hypothetical protein VKY57_00530, partial [Chitinispirillaceae bacterium]|nr:hypothetical protein [Chitinispirillaceae bacterium]
YQAEFSREPTTQECKVFAKLYARYKGQVEDLRLIHEGWIYKDGTWSTEFKLEKPRIYEKDRDKKDDAVIEYFTEIENRYAEGNFRSELISVPVRKRLILDFSNETDNTSTGLSFLLSTGKEFAVKNGLITLDSSNENFEIQFNDFAFNENPENTRNYG